MPISGLVVTFDSSVDDHSKTVESIREVPEVDVGTSDGCKLAIVIDSADRHRDSEIWNMIQKLPGVSDLAVAMVAFEQDDPTTVNDSPRKHA